MATRSLPTPLLLALSAVTLLSAADAPRPRARDLGIRVGVFDPGPLNAITDVAGVRVGHTTLATGDTVRTGVTAVLPHGGNLFQDKVAGAVFVGNAFGKLAGSTQVNELGTIETPIVLTNTLAVGTAVEAVVDYTVGLPGNEDVRSVNAVVGETNDGGLNDIRTRSVTRGHVLSAIRGAASGPVEEGSVGAGTGTRCFGWKGGIGTSSRRLPSRYGGYTVGVLVQTNYGGVLTIAGAPVGKELGRVPYGGERGGADASRGGTDGNRGEGDGNRGSGIGDRSPALSSPDGSCMIVVATDAPLEARDLQRLAARAVFALARTGSSFSNGSGDYAVAFSTSPEVRTPFGASAPRPRTVLPADGASPLFQAVLETTEEAVYNSLLRATTTTARGQAVEAIPVDRVVEILRKHGMVEAGPEGPAARRD